MPAVIPEKFCHVSNQSQRVILPEVTCAIYYNSKLQTQTCYSVNLLHLPICLPRSSEKFNIVPLVCSLPKFYTRLCGPFVHSTLKYSTGATACKGWPKNEYDMRWINNFSLPYSVLDLKQRERWQAVHRKFLAPPTCDSLWWLALACD